jgi:hypothetical protein
MTTPSEKPDENERRAQDCRAKAAYCKWVAEREPDKILRKFFARLSIEWEKEAARGAPPGLGQRGANGAPPGGR